MNIIMLWARIRDRYYDIDLDVEAPYISKDHVFDENITIAENRKRIEEENHKIQQKRAEIYRQQVELDDEFMSDIHKFIIKTFGLSSEQANGVIDWAFNEASESTTEARFVTFVKAVKLLSCIYNKDVYGLNKIPY